MNEIIPLQTEMLTRLFKELKRPPITKTVKDEMVDTIAHVAGTRGNLALQDLNYQVLKHIHVTALLVLEAPSTFTEWTHLAWTRNGSDIIVSGNLTFWHVDIVTFCRASQDANIRALFNRMLFWFEHRGLKAMFSCYKKRKLTDGTYVLDRRRQ